MQKTHNILLLVFGFAAVIAGIYMLATSNALTNAVDIPDGWEKYSTTTVSIYHPADAEIRNEAGATKIQVIGPDSIEGSEVTDGFTLFVDAEELSGQTLAEFTEIRYEEDIERSESVSEPSPIVIGDRTAYKYVFVSELGNDVSRIFMSSSDDKVFTIFYSVADPNNVGYENTLNKMFQTLELN